MAKQRIMLSIGIWAVLALGMCASSCLAATDSDASTPTRRAFVVGVQRYSDRDIQSLTRSDADADDVAADLQDMGFDKKNITLAKDIRTKDEFDKKFQAFLKTVNEGDVVFFFFSGHGIGVEATNTNYLLLANLESLKTYTRDQLLPGDRDNNDIVALKMPSYEGGYETDEIPKDGVSATEIMQSIAEKKPKVAFIVLDACRSLPPATKDIREVERGPNSGSRLLPNNDLAAGFLVLYSASFGETAIESFGPNDNRRNSLFTEVLRSEMQRPGQTLVRTGRSREAGGEQVRRKRRLRLSTGSRIFRKSRNGQHVRAGRFNRCRALPAAATGLRWRRRGLEANQSKAGTRNP